LLVVFVRQLKKSHRTKVRAHSLILPYQLPHRRIQPVERERIYPPSQPDFTKLERHLLNQEFMQALLLNFRHEGKKAIEKVARNQPGVYLKILALLVPREMKVEHSGGVKAMTDEQIEAAIEAIQAMLEQRAGESAKVIDGTSETVALPVPDMIPDERPKRPNTVRDADIAVEPSERKPRKRKASSPPGEEAEDNPLRGRGVV
jgi:hypothetical protein